MTMGVLRATRMKKDITLSSRRERLIALHLPLPLPHQQQVRIQQT